MWVSDGQAKGSSVLRDKWEKRRLHGGEYEFSFAKVWHVQQQLVVVLVSRAHT